MARGFLSVGNSRSREQASLIGEQKVGAVTLLETKDGSFAYFTQCAHFGEQPTCLLSYTCPCPCVTAHLVFNRHAVASPPFFAPQFTPPPPTSSIQGKEAFSPPNAITIFPPLYTYPLSHPHT